MHCPVRELQVPKLLSSETGRAIRPASSGLEREAGRRTGGTLRLTLGHTADRCGAQAGTSSLLTAEAQRSPSLSPTCQLDSGALSGRCKQCSLEAGNGLHASLKAPVRQATCNSPPNRVHSTHGMPSRGCGSFWARPFPLDAGRGGCLLPCAASVCPPHTIPSHVCRDGTKDFSGMDLPISPDKKLRRSLSPLGRGGDHCNKGLP